MPDDTLGTASEQRPNFDTASLASWPSSITVRDIGASNGGGQQGEQSTNRTPPASLSRHGSNADSFDIIQAYNSSQQHHTRPPPSTSRSVRPNMPRMRSRYGSAVKSTPKANSVKETGAQSSTHFPTTPDSDVENAPEAKKASFLKSNPVNRRLHLGNIHIPPFRSPQTQLSLLGLVFFFGPGLFCMLNGLGGGGLADPVPSNDALVANNIAIALVGFFAGPIVSKLGFRLSTSLGAAGYILYTSSLLTYQMTGNGPFLISSGAVLGILCSLLWTAQGAMLMSYPLPTYKGRYVSYVWTIFNLGAALGSLVSHSTHQFGGLRINVP